MKSINTTKDKPVMPKGVSVKKAPVGSSHKTGKNKAGGADPLHKAGKTISTWDSERNTSLSNKGPKNPSKK